VCRSDCGGLIRLESGTRVGSSRRKGVAATPPLCSFRGSEHYETANLGTVSLKAFHLESVHEDQLASDVRTGRLKPH